MAEPSILTVIKAIGKLSTYELGCLIGWFKMWLEDAPMHHRTHAYFLEWLVVERERWENIGGEE